MIKKLHFAIKHHETWNNNFIERRHQDRHKLHLNEKVIRCYIFNHVKNKLTDGMFLWLDKVQKMISPWLFKMTQKHKQWSKSNYDTGGTVSYNQDMPDSR